MYKQHFLGPERRRFNHHPSLSIARVIWKEELFPRKSKKADDRWFRDLWTKRMEKEVVPEPANAEEGDEEVPKEFKETTFMNFVEDQIEQVEDFDHPVPKDHFLGTQLFREMGKCNQQLSCVRVTTFEEEVISSLFLDVETRPVGSTLNKKDVQYRKENH